MCESNASRDGNWRVQYWYNRRIALKLAIGLALSTFVGKILAFSTGTKVPGGIPIRQDQIIPVTLILCAPDLLFPYHKNKALVFEYKGL